MKRTNGEWFERVLDIPIKAEFYIKGSQLWAKRDSNEEILRTGTKIYKLARRNKVNTGGTINFESAAEAGKGDTLFERVSIPQAIWSRMTPLETKPDVTFLHCHYHCDIIEECNMFRWDDRTCTILYVSIYTVLQELKIFDYGICLALFIRLSLLMGIIVLVCVSYNPC